MSENTAEWKSISQARLAWNDLLQGIKAHRVWMQLGRMDIRQKYRRSVLGPFWITLTMIIWIAAIGPLYSKLLGIGSRGFIPYLAMGIITWSLISNLILDGAAAFVTAENLVRSVKLPYTVHILRIIYRSLLTFSHNLVAFIPFMIYLRIWPQWEWLLAIPGMFLILLAALPTGFLLGTLSARYRDLQQIIANIVQLAFFLTPIFWHRELLGDRVYIADYNPFQVLIELVRHPIVEGMPPLTTYLKALVLILVLYLVAAPFFATYRRRLAFWV